MKILELRLLNWGPYIDRHSIPLDVSDQAPVVLVRGENMRGKTSLLRAITWCMYGTLKQQDGKTPIEISRMVNRQALEEGPADFEVVLVASHKGQKFELVRSGRATLDAVGDIKVESLKTMMLVGETGPIPEQSIPDFIEGILSEQIADFFFFDGEMLIRFEERLREDKESTRRFVRDQVERALGLPFLASLKTDLDEILASLATQVQKAAKGSKRAQELEEELGQVEAAFRIKESSIESLVAREVELRDSLAKIETQLESVSEIRDSFFKRKSLDAEIVAGEKDLVANREALAIYADKNWWFPLASRLKSRSDEAASKLQAARDVDRKRIRLEVRLESLVEQKSQSTCHACGQSLTQEHLHPIETQVAQVESELELLKSEVDLDSVQLTISRLADFTGGAYLQERIVEQEDDVRLLRMRLDKKYADIRRLDDVLSGNNLEIGALEAQRRQEKDRLADVALLVKQEEADVRILKSKQNEIRTDIAKLPEVNPLDRTRMRVYSEAVETAGKSFETFRSAMRSQIEAQASGIFQRLTTEKDYSGVLLRDDYSLAVLDENSRPMNMISAGANQILTMSFIGALSQSSAEEAPMVMDTPLGRLDKGHRASILEWVSSMTNQVIIFVQSGEYDPSSDADLLKGKIGREFVIERVAANSSRVVSA